MDTWTHPVRFFIYLFFLPLRCDCINFHKYDSLNNNLHFLKILGNKTSDANK